MNLTTLIIINSLLIISNIVLILVIIYQTVNKANEATASTPIPEEVPPKRIRHTKVNHFTNVIDKFYILNIDKDAYNKVYSSQKRKTTIQNQLNKLVKTSNIIRIKIGTVVYYFNNLYYAAFLFNSRDYILENIYNKEKSAKTSNEEIITIDYVLLGKHDINELNTYKPTTEVKDIVKKNH